MQITPNDSGVNKTQPDTRSSAIRDEKIIQLVNKLANKPLLIEKLTLNHTQGLLLKLLNGRQHLELQLPLHLSKHFNNVTQPDAQVSLSFNNKKQIRLIISPNDSNLDKPQKPKSIFFQKAILLENNHLKLEYLKSGGQNLNSSNLNGANINRAELNNQVIPPPTQTRIKEDASNRALLKQPSPPFSNQSNPDKARNTAVNKNSIVLNQQRSHVATPQSLQELLTNKGSQLAALSPDKTSKLSKLLSNFTGKTSNQVSDHTVISSNPISNNKSLDKVTVASAAKELINQHFTRQQPLAKSLSSIVTMTKSIELFKKPPPQIKQLLDQINQLLRFIEKPAIPTAKNIRQRVETSGHLLETKLVAQMKNMIANSAVKAVNSEQEIKPALPQVEFKTLNSSTHIQNSPIKSNAMKSSTANSAGSDQLINQYQPPTKSTTSQMGTQSSSVIDLKLHLMKIQATLESILRSSTSLTEELHKPNARQLKTSLNTTVSAESTNKISNKFSPLHAKNIHFKQQNIIFKQLTEMITEVKNTISQIESNQLLSLKNEQVNLQQFLLDLPLSNKGQIDSFELLFEHRKKDLNGKSKKHWKVVVRFDLAPLGPMFAKVELQNERISTHIFAESQKTAQLIDQNLHILKQSLSSAGVNIDQLKGSQGNIPEKLLEDNDRNIDTHV